MLKSCIYDVNAIKLIYLKYKLILYESKLISLSNETKFNLLGILLVPLNVDHIIVVNSVY